MVKVIVSKVNDIEGTLRIDTFLTGFSEKYILDPNIFISRIAATNVPVQHQSDKYITYPRGYFWRDQVERRPLGGRPPQAAYKVDNASYFAEEWALEHTIDDRQRANTDNQIGLDANAVELLTQAQMIRQDRLWAAAFWTTGVWAEDVTPSILWDAANSTPIQDVDAQAQFMQRRTGKRPNTMILGANVWLKLRVHADLVDRVKYTQTGLITLQLLAAMFNVENIRVAESIYNANAEGAADDMQYIVDPDSAWLGYIAPTAGSDTPTAIARFAWTGLIPGAMNQFGGVITRGRDDRAYTDWFHSRTAFGFGRVSQDLGVFFNNVTGALSQ